MAAPLPVPAIPVHPDTWQAWCDGTACPNPGRIGLGGLLIAPDGTEHRLSRACPHRGCNNEAEARAMLGILELARTLGARHLRIHSDSDVVVRLAQDASSTEAARLAPLFARLREQISCFSHVELQWLPQHRNLEADNLARQAIGLPARPESVRQRKR